MEITGPEECTWCYGSNFLGIPVGIPHPELGQSISRAWGSVMKALVCSSTCQTRSLPLRDGQCLQTECLMNTDDKVLSLKVMPQISELFL